MRKDEERAGRWCGALCKDPAMEDIVDATTKDTARKASSDCLSCGVFRLERAEHVGGKSTEVANDGRGSISS